MELLSLLQKHDEGNLSFKEGVSLFFTIYPDKKDALGSFLNIDDQFSRQHLKKGLDEKYQELLTNKKENQFKTFAPSLHKQNPINLEILPAELRQEHARLSPIIRRISQLHARLKYALSDKDRYEMAHEIIELTKERRGVFTKIDSFTQSGFYEKPLVVKPDPVDVQKLKNFQVEYDLKLLRSKRSKLKNNTNRVDEFNQVVKAIQELEEKRYV